MKEKCNRHDAMIGILSKQIDALSNEYDRLYERYKRTGSFFIEWRLEKLYERIEKLEDQLNHVRSQSISHSLDEMFKSGNIVLLSESLSK